MLDFIEGDDLVSGKANIVAMYHGRALYNETFDICSMGVNVIKCPMKKGKNCVSCVLNPACPHIYNRF